MFCPCTGTVVGFWSIFHVIVKQLYSLNSTFRMSFCERSKLCILYLINTSVEVLVALVYWLASLQNKGKWAILFLFSCSIYCSEWNDVNDFSSDDLIVKCLNCKYFHAIGSRNMSVFIIFHSFNRQTMTPRLIIWASKRLWIFLPPLRCKEVMSHVLMNISRCLFRCCDGRVKETENDPPTATLDDSSVVQIEGWGLNNHVFSDLPNLCRLLLRGHCNYFKNYNDHRCFLEIFLNTMLQHVSLIVYIITSCP